MVGEPGRGQFADLSEQLWEHAAALVRLERVDTWV